jgi:nucleoid-associated protein YgaU
MPPVGAPPGASTPPITVQGTTTTQPRPVSAAPQVESFDEEAYRCKPGDTFESISQRFYHTDKYARALLLFNRSHPMVSEGLQQNPPLIQVGQSVYIPPLSILEKRYSGHVQDLTPLPATQTRPVPPAAGSPVPAPGGDSTVRKYRVGSNGEWMRDIARTTLGNGDRWTDVYRLNPGFKPDMPVPANTVLSLPAEARVAPTNMP